MKTHKPTLICESNLSIAWARAFLHVLDGDSHGSLVVSIRNAESELPAEDKEISEALNDFLKGAKSYIPTIQQTALTIVPYDRWLRQNRPDVGAISKWYVTSLLPRLKARCSKNRHGTYFERLIDYTGVRRANGAVEVRTINQIAFVIDLWRKGAKKGKRPRQSALQLACFDPAKDHTGSALAGFPCLQQISLTYLEGGTLEVNAYYPTQYMVERAYGNYLGLCQLGHFIAHHLEVRLAGLTCFVANPELGNVSKSDVSALAHKMRRRVRQFGPFNSEQASAGFPK